MYGVDLSVQFENLMPAIGLGFILGFVYDIFKFIRQIFFNGKTAFFITDMIFVVVCTLSSFLLLQLKTDKSLHSKKNIGSTLTLT